MRNRYRPGLRGYIEFVRLGDLLAELHAGRAADRAAAVRALVRRLRPSARLRQAEQERLYWQGQAAYDD